MLLKTENETEEAPTSTGTTTEVTQEQARTMETLWTQLSQRRTAFLQKRCRDLHRIVRRFFQQENEYLQRKQLGDDLLVHKMGKKSHGRSQSTLRKQNDEQNASRTA